MKALKPYNRETAVSYARKYAKSRNPEFYDFSSLGGDCTNFISQCLYAGFKEMDFVGEIPWYYKSLLQRSYSWTSVMFLQKYLLSNKANVKETSLEKLQLGDIIQLKNDFYYFHSLIVTKIDDINIYVCAHSDDSLDRPLSTYFYKSLLPFHIF